jgi:DNA-binding transcriptional LysR family regulator
VKTISQIDLNLLVIFETIHAEGGVSNAARRLNLSQPAISHSLARLRALFDDRLFVRAGNGLVPTTRARELVGPIREALRGLDAALASVGAFDPAASTRKFTIGMRHFVEGPNFPALVTRLRAEAPGVSLSSVHFRRRDMSRELASGELDLVIDLVRAASDEVIEQPLETDRLMVVAREGHPRVGGAIDLSTYLALDHVLASPRPSGPGIEDVALAGLGHARRIVVRCQHAWTAWRIVAASDMICTLPRSYAEAMNQTLPNQLVDLPIALEPNNLSVYWHPAADADPGLAWLRSIIAAHFWDGD